MCGRFTLTSIDDLVADLAGIELPAELAPRFNIAPTQAAAILANDDCHVVIMARWGLVPPWARDVAIGARLINARGETLGEKPAFRQAYARCRCLVFADGFYEWQRRGRGSTPFYIRRRGGGRLAFAGVWERGRSASDLRTFSIVTTAANSLLAPLHDRMPVILSPGDHERWLDPLAREPADLADLLVPSPARELELYEVSSLVNSVANDSPACIEPHQPVQGSLF
jgi:putative SOS response-associated peptidase YedK